MLDPKAATSAALDGIGDGGGTITIAGTVNTANGPVTFSFAIDFAKSGRAELTIAITVITVITVINGTADHDLAASSLKLMASRVQS